MILAKSPDAISNKDVEILEKFLKRYENELDAHKPLLLINDVRDKLEEVVGSKSLKDSLV